MWRDVLEGFAYPVRIPAVTFLLQGQRVPAGHSVAGGLSVRIQGKDLALKELIWRRAARRLDLRHGPHIQAVHAGRASDYPLAVVPLSG